MSYWEEGEEVASFLTQVLVEYVCLKSCGLVCSVFREEEEKCRVSGEEI
jgi:hypothetical protein